MGIFLCLTALLSLVVVVLRTIYQNVNGPWHNSPPGPIFLPIFGSGPIFAKDLKIALEAPVLALHKLVQQYGPVIRMTLGTQHTVILGGLDAIREFSSLEETTGRPYNKTLLELYSDGHPLGFGIGLGGPRWKEQRKFAARALKDLAEGQKGMEEKIHREVQYTIDHIKDQLQNKSTEIIPKAERFFDLPNINIIWGLVAGIRYAFDDPRPQKQVQYLRSFLQEKTAGPMVAIDWLKYVPPFRAIYWKIRESMNLFRLNIKSIVKDQRETFDSHHIRGYIDSFILAQQTNQGTYFTDDDLLIGCQDLFIAGSETTSNTLASAILYMALHPSIQNNVHQEIDCVVGKDRPVTFDDKASLPYCEAVILETRRMSSPFPVTPPRISTKDLQIGGYKIPAGVPVQMMIYSVLRGHVYWKDPDTFLPQRFFNGSTGKLFIPEAFIPFGYGKRRCLGENLGTVSNFIFFTNLLQTFTFRCEDEAHPPSDVPKGGLTYGPQSFNIRVSLRS